MRRWSHVLLLLSRYGWRPAIRPVRGIGVDALQRDAKTGAILGTTPIGKGVDGVAFEPTLRLAISANSNDGTASVVKETETGKFETIQTVKTFTGAKTITIDSKTHQFVLPCSLPDGKGGETFGIVLVGGETAK